MSNKTILLDVPTPLAEPCFDKLREECIDYIEWLSTDDVSDDGDADRVHYIYEAAVKAVFGDNIFDWMNGRL